MESWISHIFKDFLDLKRLKAIISYILPGKLMARLP